MIRTPAAEQISCQPARSGGFRCAATGSGQTYSKIDAIRGPASSSVYSRAHLTAGIAHQLAAGKMTAAQAARFRADLARVPDSFFSELAFASRFATYGDGSDSRRRELVPPAGIPEYLVCENAGASLTCQDLNGDEHAPIGAGVYTANQASDWRVAPPRRRDSFVPAGITFTPAEYRVLFDLAATATVTTGSSSSALKAHHAPRPQARVSARTSSAGTRH